MGQHLRTLWLAERFEGNRAHLRSVAYRILGSTNDADDAVQETWLRLSRADTSAVENLTGWLTTVVARVALDMLRSRTAKNNLATPCRNRRPVTPNARTPSSKRCSPTRSDWRFSWCSTR